MKKLFLVFRNSFIKKVSFRGDFADLLKQRRDWVKLNADIIVLGISHERKKNKIGKEKDLSLTIFYVEDNPIMRFIGFREGIAHIPMMYL